MALPCPGPAPISLLDIQNEFGGTYLDGTFTQIKEYYRGGGYVANNPTNANIPTSGQISFNQFFCSSGEIIVYITTNTANVVVSSLFGSNWTANVPKRLIITNNAIVYSIYPYALSNIPIGTSPSGTSWLYGYAMKIYENVGGKFTLQINSGSSIQGAGGRRGGDAIISGETRTDILNGGQGGNAIFIGTAYSFNFLPKPIIYIENNGQISAGGGGGGKGGNGDNYSWQLDPYVQNGVTYYRFNGSLSANGGRGGLGQGYNQNNTPGEAPSAYGSGSTNLSNSINGTILVNLPPTGSNLNISNSSNSTITVNTSQNSPGGVNVSNSGNSTINFNIQSYSGLGNINLSNSGNSNINIILAPGAGKLNLSNSGNSSITVYISQGVTVNISNSGTSSIQVFGDLSKTKISNSGGSVSQNPNTNNYYPSTPTTFQSLSGTRPAGGAFDFALPTGAGSGGSGGTFGNSGTNGINGTGSSNGSGGPAGYAIDGISYVSWVTQGTVSGQTQR